jgi:uncharacterized membrane protein YgdD (TMEM256/DUF423 family)
VTRSSAASDPARPATIGAWVGLIGVAAGAFGAHALRARLDAAHLQTFETAVRYQMIHALALLVAGFTRGPGRARTMVVGLFSAGTLVFSGSLYALALGAPRWVGILTPFGGLALMGGWLALALSYARATDPNRRP